MNLVHEEPGQNQPDPAAIRAALESVTSSSEFDGAARLQEFLTYVVEEALAGRGSRIRGKTIAEDVYGRSPAEEPVVRVDAGRLRRRLDLYYAGSGMNDAVRIAVPSGGYVPVFTGGTDTVEPATAAPGRGQSTRLVLTVAVFAAVLGLAALAWTLFTGPSDDLATDATSTVPAREALFDKSPASLQAVDFAQRARELVFPPIDAARLQSALSLFERAIELDGDYYGGYAGAAQVVAFGVLITGGDRNGPEMRRARELAATAERIEPTSAWTQSALAWLAFVEGDHNRAMEVSGRAIDLDRDDAHVRDFHGMIAVMGGDYDAAIETIAPYLDDTEVLRRTIHLNVHGAASYHLGDYAGAIASFNRINSLGGASSSNPLTLAYLAAANGAAGNATEAERLVASMQEAWPGYRIDLLFRRVFRHPDQAAAVLNQLRAAGLEPIEDATPPAN